MENFSPLLFDDASISYNDACDGNDKELWIIRAPKDFDGAKVFPEIELNLKGTEKVGQVLSTIESSGRTYNVVLGDVTESEQMINLFPINADDNNSNLKLGRPFVKQLDIVEVFVTSEANSAKKKWVREIVPQYSDLRCRFMPAGGKLPNEDKNGTTSTSTSPKVSTSAGKKRKRKSDSKKVKKEKKAKKAKKSKKAKKAMI